MQQREILREICGRIPPLPMQQLASNRPEYVCYVGIEQEWEGLPFSPSALSCIFSFTSFLPDSGKILQTTSLTALDWLVHFPYSEGENEVVKKKIELFFPSHDFSLLRVPLSSYSLFFHSWNFFSCGILTHIAGYECVEVVQPAKRGARWLCLRGVSRSLSSIHDLKTMPSLLLLILLPFFLSHVSHFSCRLRHPFKRWQSLTSVDFIIWVSNGKSIVLKVKGNARVGTIPGSKSNVL